MPVWYLVFCVVQERGGGTVLRAPGVLRHDPSTRTHPTHEVEEARPGGRVLGHHAAHDGVVLGVEVRLDPARDVDPLVVGRVEVQEVVVERAAVGQEAGQPVAGQVRHGGGARRLCGA